MKTKIITFFLCFCVTTTFGQEKKTDSINFNKNEIKLNGLYLIANLFELTYERNLNFHQSLGVSVLVPTNEDVTSNYMINPFSRIFFGKKPAQGFFVEVNAALMSSEVYTTKFLYTDPNTLANYFGRETKTELDFGFGLAVGGKFVLNDKFVVDLYGGVGRFLNPSVEDFYPRLGINIGYRF